MNMPMISGLLFSDFHFFCFFFPLQLRWVRVRSVMFSCIDYDYDTRFQCSWYCCSIAMVRCRFVRKKREVSPGRGEGSQPTYGPGERRASYVNMKSLAKGRLQMVRKDAKKKGSDILVGHSRGIRLGEKIYENKH